MAAFAEQRYIIRGYDPLTYGETYIKDEDVVRPWNHKYTTERDREIDWLSKSVVGHATYGTCLQCFDSGPVNEKCRFCGYGHIYKIFRFGETELDSITLAHRLERGLVFQKADRKFDWICYGYSYVRVEELQKAVGYDRELTEQRRSIIFDRVMDMLPPDPRTLHGDPRRHGRAFFE